MSKAHDLWPADRVRKYLRYDPETGHFYNLIGRGGVAAGTRAGVVQKGSGRRKIRLPGARFYAANVAWVYMTGEWPEHLVDHKNRDTTDDRWLNLRAATTVQNAANRGMPKSNTSGAVGVSYIRWGKRIRRWRAAITKEGADFFIGHFATRDKADAAYRSATIALNGEFAPCSSTATP